MNKLSWCMQQKGGISLVKPNSNLAEAYLAKAEKSLEAMRINQIKEWKIATAYYTMYFSLYSILMKIGIKCEIHSCTLEFARTFLGGYFSGEELDFFENSLKARIDAQYYVDRNVPDKQFQQMIERSPEFFIKCKSITLRIKENQINEIRNKLKEASKSGAKL